MKQVNPILMEFFYRSAVSNLPPNIREIYQFVEMKEDELESESSTEQQFFHLLVQRSPLKEAAKKFALDIETIVEMIDKAQKEIDRVMKERCNRMKWIDCSNWPNKWQEDNNAKWSFLFLS